MAVSISSIGLWAISFYLTEDEGKCSDSGRQTQFISRMFHHLLLLRLLVPFVFHVTIFFRTVAIMRPRINFNAITLF